MSVSAHHVHLVEIHCAFDKVFLRVAACRMTEGASQASGRHSHLLQPEHLQGKAVLGDWTHWKDAG